MTKHQLEDAESLANATDIAYRNAKRDKDSEYEEKRYALEKEVYAAHAERLNAAYKAHADAKLALEAARTEFNEAGGGIFPPGTILVRWSWPRWYDSNSQKRKLTDDKAIVQVFKTGDDFVGGRWNKPESGSLVVRVLKKDGKPGKKCFRLQSDIKYTGWCLPGIDPNVEEAK